MQDKKTGRAAGGMRIKRREPKSNQKKTLSVRTGSLYSKPGSDLLSHGETPHYHRRYCVSRLSSAWDQVVPQRYGYQAKLGALQFEKAKNLSQT